MHNKWVDKQWYINLTKYTDPACFGAISCVFITMPLVWKTKHETATSITSNTWLKVDVHDNKFISNLDIFPLISPSDIVSLNKLSLILKIIGQCDFKYLMTCHQTHCDTSDNVCLDFKTAVILYLSNSCFN